MARKKSPTNRALGDAIRAARKSRGHTQESFALEAGLDRSYYGAIERGEFNVTVAKLTRVAAGLNVKVWELLRRADL